MSIKKIFEKYTPEEIAEAFIFPTKLTAKQQLEANKQLAEHRENRRAAMTETENCVLSYCN